MWANQIIFEKFVKKRNKAKQMIRNVKLRYAHFLFTTQFSHDEFYKIVKKILPKPKDIDTLLSPDELVESFSSVSQPIQSLIDSTSFHYSKNYTFGFTEVSFKRHPSFIGYDQILYYLNRMLDIVAHIFNFSVEKG